MESANIASTAIISRSTPAAISGTSELLFAHLRGQELVIIANTFSGFGATLVLSKQVAGRIGIDSSAPVPDRLKALNGLMIASPSATSDYTFSFRGAARAVGADVRFTFLDQTTMAAALQSGAIDGYVASAPNWVPPVLSGVGIIWLSGPKSDLPSNFMPRSSSSLQMRRDTAVGNPELARKLAAVHADLVRAIDERPDDVKTAILKFWPNLSPPALDLIYSSEGASWKAKALMPDDIAHDIEFLKSTGAKLDGVEKINLESLIVR
ncbi:MAG: ABC transporter substrate-binding protein [Bosea sp.]|nr:ABC transporter substrate-binding protein [Bosea sp. (in: a-proteobacteria)]